MCIGHDGSHCQTCKAVSWGLQFNATQKKDNCLVCVRIGSPKSNVFRTAFSLVKWPQIGGKSFSFRHSPNIKHQTHGNGSTPTSNLLTAVSMSYWIRFFFALPWRLPWIPQNSFGEPASHGTSIPFVGFRFQTVTLTFSECEPSPKFKTALTITFPPRIHPSFTCWRLGPGSSSPGVSLSHFAGRVIQKMWRGCCSQVWSEDYQEFLKDFEMAQNWWGKFTVDTWNPCNWW